MLLFAYEPPRSGTGADDPAEGEPEGEPKRPNEEQEQEQARPLETGVDEPPVTRPDDVAPPGPPAPESDAPASAAELPHYPRDPGRTEPPLQPAPSLPEDDLPSYPRRDDTGGRTGGLLSQRLWIIIIALAVIALLAYVFSRFPDEETIPDVMSLAVAAAPTAEMGVSTVDPVRAAQFVRDEFGWRVGVPVFEAAQLQGAGIATIALGVEVPVFLYIDDEDRQAVTFALNYALLDQVPDRIRLDPADYERLAEDTLPRTRRVRGSDVVLWRDRADIFITVTEIPAEIMVTALTVVR